MKYSVLLILLLLGATVQTNAQSIGPSTLNATGGTTIIGANEFEWSVGEMTMVSTFTGTGIVVTQGVLQPHDASPSSVINNSLAEHLQVFPNPATSVVNVQYASAAQGTLSYQLMDLSGKVIETGITDVKQGTTTERISVSSLPSATYLLEVIVNKTGAAAESASYKIQKF